jgi:hypothetical protein
MESRRAVTPPEGQAARKDLLVLFPSVLYVVELDAWFSFLPRSRAPLSTPAPVGTYKTT